MLKQSLLILLCVINIHVVAQSNCDSPTSYVTFEVILNDISDEISEDEKLSTSKKLIEDACLTTNQIKQILEVITYESYKLEFAKFAYHYCFDVFNYDNLYDEFSFSSSQQELKEYIESQN